jgi:hypothetical protein
MSNPESIFNPDEYSKKIEVFLTPEHIKLLMEKAKELNISFTVLLEIVISNYQPITQEEIDHYNDLELYDY